MSSPNLESLTLSENEIQDLSPLGSLTKLKQLDLANNQINDASVLANLTRLTALNLAGNKIQSADFLASLPGLTELNLSSTGIQVLPDLSHLSGVQKLDLSSNQLASIPGIASLTSLQVLLAQKNKKIGALESLRQLRTLRELDASGCSLGAVPELPKKLNDGAQKLRLELSENQISDISAFARISYPISILHLKKNELSDLSDLASLPKIESLDISFNKIQDLAPLNQIDLASLDATHNQIASLDRFSPGAHLLSLNLSHNKILRMAPLASVLPNLRFFGISDNPVEDIGNINSLNYSNDPVFLIAGLGLQSLEFLKYELIAHAKGIDVSRNNLSSVDPLLNAAVADFIYVGCNPNLPADEVAALKKQHMLRGSVSDTCSE